MRSFFSGRALSVQEIERVGLQVDQVEKLSGIKKIPAIQKTPAGPWCYRCGNRDPHLFYSQPCSSCSTCLYCLDCLQMGKMTSCSFLYQLAEANDFDPLPAQEILTWQGQLSDQQSQASNDIIASIHHKEERLIWAVTGAGKTEMLFEGLALALSQGLRIALASPRVDVCLELAPRLKQAFQSVDQICLHGQMDEAYRYCPLTLSTTHQLLRFKEAFDLVIVDEVDAFPYHNNRLLEGAVQAARKTSSTLIYLSATPDQAMQKRVQSKDLKASILPARYHGHPLPEVRFKWAGDWKRQLLNHPPSSPVFKTMVQWLENGRRFLLFLPNIQWMQTFDPLCRQYFKGISFESVHSQDPDRRAKVMKMRQGDIDFLMTTTILERGVTFTDIDVMVVGADDRIFTESALVQIAGRVGRHQDFPTGQVIFYHRGQSRAMKRARQQIIKMNQLARKRGLVHG